MSALLPTRAKSGEPAAIAAAAPALVAEATAKQQLPEQFEEFQSISLDRIKPGGNQPRENFDEAKLEELSASIRVHGVIQPITVQRSGDNEYRIIAGERRWRAAQLAGHTEIPALVRSAPEGDVLELALIENIQREDLNPIEIATAFERLHRDHGLSHEDIAGRTGKDRTTVTNTLRLLKLSPRAREELIGGAISMGHARAILNMNEEDQGLMCDEIKAKQLSVRTTEAIAKRVSEAPIAHRHIIQNKPVTEIIDPNIRAAVDEMSMALGTRVKLYPRTEASGRLEVEYYSQEDLERIYSVIVKQE